MIRTVNSWISFIFKKTLTNKAFFAMLVLIPVIALSVSFLNSTRFKKEDQVILLYAREENEFSDEVFEGLLGEYKNYIFEYADDEEQIYSDVRNHRALCGYILDEDQIERALEGERDDNIILVERSGNINTDIVNEIVFSNYYKVYAKYYAMSFIHSGNYEEFESNYESIVSKSLLNYEIIKLEPEDSDNAFTLSGRNFIGIIIFVYGLLLLSSFIDDKKKGILYPVKKKGEFIFRIVYFLTPLLMMAPFAYLGALAGNGSRGFIKEALILAFYILLLTLVNVVMSYVIKRKIVVISFIPVLTILFILICPVFADLSTFVPVIKVLRYLCLPYYYMM